MDRREIAQEAARRMEMMEERFADCHLDQEFMALYRLLSLLRSASFERHFAEFGWLPIHPGDISDAKAELNWGPLTQFERDCIELLNQEVDRREKAHEKPTRTIVGLRTYG